MAKIILSIKKLHQKNQVEHGFYAFQRMLPSTCSVHKTEKILYRIDDVFICLYNFQFRFLISFAFKQAKYFAEYVACIKQTYHLAKLCSSFFQDEMYKCFGTYNSQRIFLSFDNLRLYVLISHFHENQDLKENVVLDRCSLT